MAGYDGAGARSAAYGELVPIGGPRARGRRVAPALSPPPLLSVIIPTRGNSAKLAPLLEALARQTLPPSEREILLSFDGAGPDPEVAARAAAMGARVIEGRVRSGPGAARNRAAASAHGEFLVFTEDDCIPARDWLERLAERLNREPDLDVLEGSTVQPDGRPTRRPDPARRPHYLPTNLAVRRTLFDRVGGYRDDYFDPRSGTYFREDSDLGFTLEEAGARIASEPSARTVHPVEHPGYLDPLRWARRFQMDALLSERHPDRFRDRIEVHALGPFRIRRPFVRACWAHGIALVVAGIAWAAGEPGLAAALAIVAAIAFLPIWAKWRFDPIRLPVLVLVPLVLVVSQLRGRFRAGRLR